MENGNASHQLNYEYDVYHSYGPPCGSLRRKFQNFLHVAMNNKGLSFVQNNEDLIRWNDNIPISPPRIESMEESRILIVSISANYASSVFSLNELVEILNCMKLRNQMVCPVFVQVDPSDLRHLRNSFGKAMTQHEHRFGSNSEDVKKWKSALIEISNLSGWHLQTPWGTAAQKSADMVVSWITRSLKKYDVFLSFSGTDTRYVFTGFLYNSLHRNGFKTFMEDEGWGDGEKISQFHIQAIEESKFSIIVFSNNYAYSSCRLDALIKILECKKLNNQQVFPIFYKVQPSVVRYQTGYFGEAMAIHENRFGRESEKVRRWKAALSEVASLSGWPFKENQYLHITAQEIVDSVKKSLPRYEVFLSFRGPDTRYNFIGWLYDALSNKGIRTFLDDHDLKHGEPISQALINVIRESKFAIIVFSENYAYSEWCLDELVEILERKRTEDYQVWPIYYKVKPSDVWYQRNSYGKAMEKHEDRYGKRSNRVRGWRSALSKVADLEILQFENGYDHKLVEQIVDKTSEEIRGRTLRQIHVL